MLKIENLSYKYKKKRVLNNISLNINKGDIIALVGQNGAGKSTLIKEILRLGKVKISYMSESITPDSKLTVYEFINYFAHINNNSNSKEIDSILEKCNLEKNKNDLSSTLSKGNKQRLALASTLISGGDLFLLDEPSAGFDPLFQKEMSNILKNSLKGKTAIISTHNISEVDEFATKIVILKDGVINFYNTYKKGKSYYEYF